VFGLSVLCFPYTSVRWLSCLGNSCPDRSGFRLFLCACYGDCTSDSLYIYSPLVALYIPSRYVCLRITDMLLPPAVTRSVVEPRAFEASDGHQVVLYVAVYQAYFNFVFYKFHPCL